MRGKILKAVVLVSVACCLSPLAAGASSQEKKQESSATVSQERQMQPDYRVEYSVRELADGKRVNTRDYKVFAQSGATSRIRVGNRVPYTTGMGPGDMFQYQDVGINIDCRVMAERDGAVLLSTTFESSTVAQEARNMGAGGFNNPVIRRVRAEGMSMVPLDKPTVIDVVDDVTSDHRYEVEVTVTKVK